MTKVSCNCIVCAKEFDPDELQNVALSEINKTYFKVCEACFAGADPINDYSQVREILGFYMSPRQAKSLFDDAKSILSSMKKS